MKYTTAEIESAYKESSPKIRQILDDVWVANVCGDIGRELDLRIDKVDSLIRVVGLTLLNVVPVSDFIKICEEELEISTANATTVAKKVDEFIFQKIREIVVSGNENIEDILDNTNIVNDENIDLIKDIENRADDNLSFKDKFNKVTVKEVEERIVDPYREAID